MKNALLRTLAFALLPTLALAEGTQRWTQSSFDEFIKGTAKGIAIRSDGTLELAPAFKAVSTTPSTYIWAIASDPQGDVYAAAGSPARVYRITPAGQATIVFQPTELQVQALVADKNGVLYAATSPDGKVYKIEHKAPAKKAKPQPAPEPAQNPSASDAGKTPVDASFTSSVFFDPKTKYIWDMALDAQGQLFVATGDRGEIFRVNRGGEGSVFFKSDEAHIRVLAFDPRGNLIAGSDGSGLIYRVSPTGEAFVLYSAAKKEITALAIDAAGNIYAAGVGEKRPQQGGQPNVPPFIPPQPTNIGGPPGSTITITTTAQPIVPPGLGAFPNMAPSGGSEIYMIAPDGSPKRIWTPREDIVYALGFDKRGNLLAGTGNRGHIFLIQPNGDFTDLVKASANQVTSFAVAPGGLYCSTSNLGKIFLVGSAPEAEGTYESDVFDAKVFSRWGRAEVRSAGLVELFARSGNVDNPDRNWSAWKKVDLQKDAPVEVPAARFIQWRAVLRPGATAPGLDSVALNYLPKNVAPVIDDVAVQVGARFPSVPRQTTDNTPINVGGPSTPQPRFEMPTPALRDRDSIGVRWSARDDNDDQLLYSVYYRGDGETQWKLLKDKITDKFYSWDAGLLPDGGYTINVIASDAPSHSPDEALTASKESSRFEVDHTPPQVADLNARVDGAALRVTFRGLDNFSPIKRAEYSVDAGDWQFVEPVGELSDSKTESYDFQVPAPKPEGKPPENDRAARGGDGNNNRVATKSGEHVIVIRVYDRYDNMGTGKAVFQTK
jgi:hypothetical protein